MPVVLTIVTTGRPKRFILERAFEFISSAGYEFDHTPEEVGSALAELDMMMAEWPWNQLGYNAATYGTGLPEDLSGLPDSALSAVSKYLGLRIAPGMAATVSAEAKAAMTRSYNLLFASVASPPAMPFAPNTPRGAGNRWGSTWGPFINETAE